MSKIDLHIHSKVSDDGEYSPREIVTKCKLQGMRIVSVTDHNSVRAVAEALTEADRIRVISGVELDCTYCGKNFHLLGYGFDHTREEYTEVEQDILRQEKSIAEKKIRLFERATGIPVKVEEIIAASGGGVVTGELIAELVLARPDAKQYGILRPYLPGGTKSDMPNVRFYWDFFSEGKPAYVPVRYLSLPDAVALIHSTGGVAVLAHPGQNLAGDDTLLPGIIAEKIDGIEVFSSYHTQATSEHYLEIALQNHLLVTCGSDFHGKHKPKIRLGGHGALWEDSRLVAGMETWLSGLPAVSFL